jgi:DNA (cytosine-5)-methyltransferase 1
LRQFAWYAGSKQQQQERQGYGCNGEWMPEFATRIGASGKDINRRHSGQFERPPEVAQMELANSNGNRFDKGRQRVATAWSHGPIRNDWWESEPAVGRVANGIPARVDRLRGLGNAVVPQVAEYVGRRVVETLTA